MGTMIFPDMSDNKIKDITRDLREVDEQIQELIAQMPHGENISGYSVNGSYFGSVDVPDPWDGTFHPMTNSWWTWWSTIWSRFPWGGVPPADFDLDPVPAPELKPMPDINTNIYIPDFTTPEPVLDIPPSPTFNEFQPPNKPEVTTPPSPDKPTLVWPDVPVFDPIAIPEAVTLSLPTFDETFPDEDLLLPTYEWNFTEEDYNSALKDAITNGLLTEINDGGYGLNPNDETLLFQRAREREDYACQKAIEEVKRHYSMSGFPIPVGAMTKQMEKAVFDSMAKSSSINRELTIKRADLYWEGKKFCFTTGVQMEQLTMNLHNSRMERKLNAAKAQLEAMIQYFNAQIARYNAHLAKYKMMAEVYEIRIRAELAKVEIFKAQIEAAKLQGDLQKNQVELYKAQVDGVKALIEAYKVDAEVMNVLMLVEKTKMDVYRAEVDAFASIVQAEKVKFEAYEAKIKGELAKAQAYEASARAYAAMIEGKKAQVDVQKLILAAYQTEMDCVIKKYEQQVKQKKDIRDAQSDQLKADVMVYEADVKGYVAQIEAVAKMAEVEVRAAEAACRIALIAMEQAIEIAKLEMTRAVELTKCATQLSIAQIEANAKIAAAELGQWNTNIGVSSSAQRSQHQQTTQQNSTSTDQSHRFGWSESVSTNHNYNHEE